MVRGRPAFRAWWSPTSRSPPRRTCSPTTCGGRRSSCSTRSITPESPRPGPSRCARHSRPPRAASRCRERRFALTLARFPSSATTPSAAARPTSCTATATRSPTASAGRWSSGCWTQRCAGASTRRRRWPRSPTSCRRSTTRAVCAPPSIRPRRCSRRCCVRPTRCSSRREWSCRTPPVSCCATTVPTHGRPRRCCEPWRARSPWWCSATNRARTPASSASPVEAPPRRAGSSPSAWSARASMCRG